MLSGFAAMWASGSRFGIAWLDPVVPDLTALAFAVLTWELWRCQGPVARLLSLRPLVYLGKISYGCYIFHLFAIQENARVINALHLNALPVRSRSLVALAVTILAAIASWHLFESPILSIKSRFAYGRRVTIPVDALPAGTTLASS